MALERPKLRNIALMASIAALTAVLAKREVPIPAPAETPAIPHSLSWESDTTKHINLLASEFALDPDDIFDMSANQKDATPPEILLARAQRFRAFLATYAPDLQINHIGKENSPTRKAVSAAMRTASRLHGAHTTAFYANKVIYMPENGSHRMFVPELAHYMNQDQHFRRICKFAYDHAASMFRSKGVYDDARAGEFQAHNITQPLLVSYLRHLYLNESGADFSAMMTAAYTAYAGIFATTSSIETTEARMKLVEMNITLPAETDSAANFVKNIEAAMKGLLTVRAYLETRTDIPVNQRKKVFEKISQFQLHNFDVERTSRVVEALMKEL
ncbi:MAG: hypothetical protein RI911_261 [Candidatus Parcubacteria bacterium]|jgi:hypothetical protein